MVLDDGQGWGSTVAIELPPGSVLIGRLTGNLFVRALDGRVWEVNVDSALSQEKLPGGDGPPHVVRVKPGQFVTLIRLAGEEIGAQSGGVT